LIPLVFLVSLSSPYQGGDDAREEKNLLYMLHFFLASPEVGRAAEDLRQPAMSEGPQSEQQCSMAAGQSRIRQKRLSQG